MDNYPQRSAENIIPLSVSNNLSEAFKEWYFTEKVEDHEIASEECGLCDQERLRYKFEIKNKYTNKNLWVGSSCILKFQVQVFDNGKLLDARASKKKLDEISRKMRLDSCINALTKLAEREKNDILSNALQYYLDNKFLTPKYAWVVFWKLDTHKIDYSPSFFKITTKKPNHKYDLSTMETSRVHLIWKALSSTQKAMAVNMGHTAPDKK